MKKRYYLAFVAVLAVLLGIAYTLQPKETITSQPVVETKTETKQERKILGPPPTVESLLAAVNAERSKAGVKPLTIDPRLNQSAQMKSVDMLKMKESSHVNRNTGKHGYEYITEVGVKCILQSENIVNPSVDDYADTNTPSEIVKGWMTSEPHRNAILDPRYETTGFGIADNYITEHFCDIN
jgi:uncharacterized protein YkwD